MGTVPDFVAIIETFPDSFSRFFTYIIFLKDFRIPGIDRSMRAPLASGLHLKKMRVGVIYPSPVLMRIQIQQ
jgi:hypothetical protein